MYYRKIESLPPYGRRKIKETNNAVQQMLIDFYDSDLDRAEVVYDTYEYISSASLYSSLIKAVKALDLPIDVSMRAGAVYLCRI